MADQPSLHIDTDWKRQAQEEKRRLAEEEERKRQQAGATPPPPPTAGSPGMGAPPAAPGAAAGGARAAGATGAAGAAPRDRGAYPPASFATLVQSLVTQILFHLGELAPRGTEPQLNLDMAKHNIDMLGVIEDKTRGNLTPEEQRLLDGALYETRMRYVAVATQFAVV